MHNQRCLMALLVVTLFIAQAKGSSDQLSLLVTSALTAEARPFQGTDGRRHIVYELVLTNTNPTAATAQISTTMNVYGNALMEAKREASTKVVRKALRSA